MFGKRFSLIKFAGFDIGIDISWFFIAILLTWTLAAGYFPFIYKHLTTGTYIAMGLLGMLGLFLSVLLHELGHAVVARAFQLPISRITLFIFGGIAELKNEPSAPKAEFYVAIAGPIVSIVLAGFFYLLTEIGYHAHWTVAVTAVTGYLSLINFVIVIFNLIPAFPLDGGRIFRALLWWWRGDLGWATGITTRLGSAFGLTLLIFGFFFILTGSVFAGLWWILIGLFLNQAAISSRTQYYMRRELQGECVEKFMTKNPIAVPPGITLKQCIDQYLYQSYHHLYPVTDQGRLLGYISLKEIKAVPSDKWDTTTVLGSMVPLTSVQTVTPKTNAIEALGQIQEAHTPTLLVVEGDQLVGLLTAQDLFKIISMKLELS
jgi:Zn-dependent protease/CBS domain-containing protein